MMAIYIHKNFKLVTTSIPYIPSKYETDLAKTDCLPCRVHLKQELVMNYW